MFDTAFFGYSELPDSIELENRKLIPIKTLNQSACFIRSVCKIVGIQLHRPVKGLYCIEEDDFKFFDYIRKLQVNDCNYWYSKDYIQAYNNFLIW